MIARSINVTGINDKPEVIKAMMWSALPLPSIPISPSISNHDRKHDRHEIWCA